MEHRDPPPRSTVLRTPRLVLRPSDVGDAKRAFEIVSDWEVARNLAAVTHPLVLSDQQAWFESHLDAWADGRAYRFAVLLRGEMIGLADLDGVSAAKAELGYWFAKAWWGNGYATEAARALVGFAVDALRLDRLTAGHAADNLSSGRVLSKLGFRCTGETETYSRSRRETIAVLTYVWDRESPRQPL